MSVIKLLKLQDEDMSSPYDKKIFIQTTLSIASKQSTHTIFIS